MLIHYVAITVMDVKVFVHSHLCEITGAWYNSAVFLREFSSFYFVLEHARSVGSGEITPNATSEAESRSLQQDVRL